VSEVKRADVGGKFYPSGSGELGNAVSALQNSILREYECAARAVIAPHAGYVYSGELAANALQYLPGDTKNVFVFSPAHRVNFNGVAICDYDSFETPLGNVPVNSTINGKLAGDFGCKVFNSAFDGEHAIEVQLPFLKTNLPNARIVPLIVGNGGSKKVAGILEEFWDGGENSFVFSSDLSHFLPEDDGRKLDLDTCGVIEACDHERLSSERACGAEGIRGLLKFAGERGFSPIRIGLSNSAKIFGDKSSVVGYGAWLLAECSVNKFVKTYFQDYAISLCNGSIKSFLDGRDDFPFEKIPEVFQQHAASFVTLKIRGNLRGCIGSIIAHQPLITDLVYNSRNAAFHDPRFLPLTAGEFENVKIGVSLLSQPKRIRFDSEQMLLSMITPGIDGVVIKDGIFQAVYLPGVWEQLPDKREFLASLKVKAGLSPVHFSKNFEAFKFSSEVIE
jgi:AmmeMemoRadiSam system protein B/AmmeMemoRadiSam system protein A